MFLLIQSILVYGLMIWVMTYYGKIAYRRQYPLGYGAIDCINDKKLPFYWLFTKTYFIIPIFVICFFSAIRYKVGVDCESYKMSFYGILQFGGAALNDDKEGLFVALAKTTQIFTNSHYMFFFILVFMQIGTLYYALRKKSYAIIYLGITLILSSKYLSLMNGMRQNIAACILIASIPLILEKKKWGWFLLATFVASSMHKSAMFFIPIGLLAFYVLRKGILSIPIQLVIIAICYLMMDKLELPFLDSLFSYGDMAGYDSRSIDVYSNLEATNKNFGFSSWLSFLTQILAIIYSKRIQTQIKDNEFNTMYNLFFISVCIGLLLYNNFTIGRLNYYFSITEPIILSIMLFYMRYSKKKLDNLLFYFTIFLLIIKFSFLLYKASTEINEYTLYKFDFFNL